MAGRLEVGGIYSLWQGETASCSWRFLVHRTTSKPVKRARSASLHSSFNFCHHKVIGWFEWHTHTQARPDIPSHFVSLYLSLHRCLALSHAHCLVVCLHPSFTLLCLTLTIIMLWIGVTASEEVRLTSNPYFLLSRHLITVEKTCDFSIHISQCPTYTGCSEVNWSPALKFSWVF